MKVPALAALGLLSAPVFAALPLSELTVPDGFEVSLFAENVTFASYRIEEADRQALRDVGFSDRDIWDIVNVAAFFNMSNRVSSAVGMEPNPEYHNLAR